VVVARVKGGLSVDIGVKAFLPGSQVDLRPIRNLDKLIGQRFKFKVIKFNKKRGNIVLSRRVLLEQEREEQKRETLKKLSEGATMTGVVKNLTDYGAFVDLGGIDGLLHITDMSWGRINHPSEMFNIGDEIKVKVLKFDPDTERGLSRLQADHRGSVDHGRRQIPGRQASVWQGGVAHRLRRLCGAGAGRRGPGARLGDELDQARQAPEQARQPRRHRECPGARRRPPQKRISLGMKQIEPNPGPSSPTSTRSARSSKGGRNITDFGIFVGVEEGIDGLVHISDLSWTHRVKHPSELFTKGDEVEAVVLNIDVENERFSLGIKQLTDDPWETLPRRFPRGTKVKGKVMKVTDYGIFVEIEPGIDGLCHISEISDERVEKPADVVKQAQEVEVMVLDVDPGERRISLSIKAARDGTSDYRAYMGNEAAGRAHLGELLADKLAAVVGTRKARTRNSRLSHAKAHDRKISGGFPDDEEWTDPVDRRQDAARIGA